MRDLNDYQDQYSDYPFEEILVKYRKKKIIEILRQYNPSKILEIGCGYDPIVMHYDNFDEFCIVEPTSRFHENASRVLTTHKKKHQILLRKEFLENDTDFLKDRDFDFVILAGLLHEVESPNTMLQSVHSILKKDAILHINVPNAHSLHRLIALHAGLIEDICELSESNKRFQQNTVFQLDQIKHLLVENSFEILDSGTIFIKPFTHSQMQKLVDLEILNDAIMDGLFKATSTLSDLGSEIYLNVKVK